MALKPPPSTLPTTAFLTVLLIPTLFVAASIVRNGVGLSDDSFLYIDRGLSLSIDFAFGGLKPGWFPAGYGGLIGVFLGIDNGPIGAASWLNAVLLLIMIVTLFMALRELTGDTTTALALALTAVFTKGVTWPFQFAWAEPLFLTISAIHAYALIRYCATRKLAYLSIFAVSGPLLIWTRFAGASVLLPLLLFAGFDLYRSKQHRLAQAGIYLLGFALFAIVPIWSPGRFVHEVGSQPSLNAAWFESLHASIEKLFFATQDATGAAVFYAFGVTALGWMGWLVLRGVWFRRSAPPNVRILSDHQVARLIVFFYSLIWLVAFNALCIEHQVQVTKPGDPIDPFIELRFAAANLPWILIGLGALWGAVPRTRPNWPIPFSKVAAVVSATILTITFATEYDTVSRFLFPTGTTFPFHHGYSREHGEEANQVAELLNQVAGEEPLVVGLLAPTREGMLPPSYFRSVFFLPHASPTQPSALRFTVTRLQQNARHRYEMIIDGKEGRLERSIVHYVESTADLPPETVIEQLSRLEKHRGRSIRSPHPELD